MLILFQVDAFHCLPSPGTNTIHLFIHMYNISTGMTYKGITMLLSTLKDSDKEAKLLKFTEASTKSGTKCVLCYVYCMYCLYYSTSTIIAFL